MLKVIGYARVSTEDMAREGVSLNAQHNKIEQYARLHDLELIDVIVDAGVSAKSLERPGLARALGQLDAGLAGALVIAKLDRLSRSVRDFATLIERYFDERAGKTLMSVSDSIDTRTAAGRLVLNVLMSVAQWERETIVERTTDALRFKKSKGERVGHVPFGFDLAEDGRTLIVNEREQAARKLIARWRIEEGRTFKAINDGLLELGHKPKSGRAVWSCGTLFFIARNP